MKTILKIIIGVSIIFLCAGIAFAAHNNEIFTAPYGLQAVGNNDFVDLEGHNIMILECTDDAKKTWFENDTDPEYLVEPYSGNPNIYLGVTDDNDCYILEVVEKDNSRYIIGSWTPNDSDDDFKMIWENLQEFNDLNKLTPLEA